MGIPSLPGFTTLLVPLSNVPQSFEIVLVETTYLMTVKWNDAPEAGWVFDLLDVITDEYLVANIPLITGANCLEGLDYLDIGGKMYVYTDGDDTAVPTYENLGVESNLYFLTEAPDA